MYLGEIHYGALSIASVIATALSILWYSTYVFGKQEGRVTLRIAAFRLFMMVVCTVTLSALLNSLLITDIVNLISFIFWISLGVCATFVVPFVLRREQVGVISSVLIEVGHIILVVFTISSLLFLLQ